MSIYSLCPFVCLRPSFNVPYFEQTSHAAGYKKNSWKDAPRHCIFEKIHVNATTPEGMQFVMRWNDYHHEACSKDNPINAIAARADLLAAHERSPIGRGPQPFGALDAKWASWSSAVGRAGQRWEKNAVVGAGAGDGGGAPMKSFATCGPTHEKGQQQVFCWSKLLPKLQKEPHLGHPDCYGFGAVEMAPRAF
jgi:hypothetical protein